MRLTIFEADEGNQKDTNHQPFLAVNIEQSHRKVSPFAGFYFIVDALTRLGINSFISDHLPKRSANATYSYADIALSLFANCMLEGERLSDLVLIKEKFFAGQGFLIPSPDTVEYACQQLKPAVCVEQLMNQKGNIIEHQHCYSPLMNALLLSLAIKTGQLKTGSQGYTIDYDHMVLATDKQDARLSYKQVRGYHPGMAAIGRIPVFIQNHNGNTPARHQQKDSLALCFNQLAAQGIEIENFRADSASYQADVIELVDSSCKQFYIRMLDFKALRSTYGQMEETTWKTVQIGHEKVEVASLPYQPAKSEKTYRLVVTRRLKEDRQLDLETGTAYRYGAIITNDEVQSEQEVIQFYNLRGDAENTNRYMLNDFNLSHLPFMDMNTNTVYMYLMGYAAILFEWAKTVLVQNKVAAITTTMRVKAVCFHYLSVAGEWVLKKGKQILKIYTSTTYKPLQI